MGVIDEDEGKDASDDDEDEDWDWGDNEDDGKDWGVEEDEGKDQGDDEEDEGNDASTSQDAQGLWQYQKAGEEVIEQIGPHKLRMNQSANTLSPEFWTPELQNSKFLLC